MNHGHVILPALMVAVAASFLTLVIAGKTGGLTGAYALVMFALTAANLIWEASR